MMNAFTFLTLADLRARPGLEWLIEGIIPEAGLVTTVGPSGIGKTTAALDRALHIQTGTPWQGRETKQGQVVYIAAEGIRGIAARIDAWAAHHGVEDPEILVYPLPVDLTNPGVACDFVNALEAIEDLALVVIDTTMLCLGGGDDSSSKDVTAAFHSAHKIRGATGATVEFIHHTTKAGDQLRGSVVFKDHSDAMINLGGSVKAIKMSCTKMRDSAEFEDIHLSTEVVAGHDALVIVSGSMKTKKVDTGEDAAKTTMHPDERSLIAALRRFGDEGATPNAWMAAAEVTRSIYNYRRPILLKAGLVKEVEGRYKIAA